MSSTVPLAGPRRIASVVSRGRAALATVGLLASLGACSSAPAPTVAPPQAAAPASSPTVASEEVAIAERVGSWEKTCPGLFVGNAAPDCEKDVDIDRVYAERVRTGDQTAHLRALARHLMNPANAAHRGVTLLLLNSALSVTKGGNGQSLVLRPAPFCTDASTAPLLLDALPQARPASEAMAGRLHRLRMGVAFGLGCIDIEGLKLGAKLDETFLGLDPEELGLLVRYLAIYNQDSPTFLARAERLVTDQQDYGAAWVLEVNGGIVHGLLEKTEPPQGTGNMCPSLLNLAFVTTSLPDRYDALDASLAFVEVSPVPGVARPAAASGASSAEGRCVTHRDKFLDRLEAVSARMPLSMPGSGHLEALRVACRDPLTPTAARERAKALSFTFAQKLEPVSAIHPVLHREALTIACECDAGRARPLALAYEKKTGQKIESCKP